MNRNRSAVIKAMENLTEAGYAVQGNVHAWHTALERLSDGAIGAAVKAVISSYTFNKVYGANVADKAREESYLAPVTDLLNPASWEQWTDSLGREHAWHPSIKNHPPPAGYDPSEEKDAPQGRKLTSEETRERAEALSSWESGGCDNAAPRADFFPRAHAAWIIAHPEHYREPEFEKETT